MHCSYSAAVRYHHATDANRELPDWCELCAVLNEFGAQCLRLCSWNARRVVRMLLINDRDDDVVGPAPLPPGNSLLLQAFLSHEAHFQKLYKLNEQRVILIKLITGPPVAGT